jgi:transcriptional regulator with XRE-family HTH domain
MLDAEYLNEYYRTMGMVIRRIRQKHYKSMEIFAEKIGMKFQQYSKCELGRNMRTDTILRILEGLNVDHGEFYKEVHTHMKNWEKINRNNTNK